MEVGIRAFSFRRQIFALLRRVEVCGDDAGVEDSWERMD